MPRTARAAQGGIIYHVLNRGNGRQTLFRKDGDYAAFVKILLDAREHARIDLLAYCLMPDHWHLVLLPHGSHEMAGYLSWLTEQKVEAIRTSMMRDRPLGSDAWVRKMAARMGLEYTLRPRGRPRKVKGSG